MLVYIGIPKQPTVTLYVLAGDRYERQVLHRGDRLHSPTCPTLNLTADQIISAGG
jgi:Uma2 family endonuclease